MPTWQNSLQTSSPLEPADTHLMPKTVVHLITDGASNYMSALLGLLCWIRCCRRAFLWRLLLSTIPLLCHICLSRPWSLEPPASLFRMWSLLGRLLWLWSPRCRFCFRGSLQRLFWPRSLLSCLPWLLTSFACVLRPQSIHLCWNFSCRNVDCTRSVLMRQLAHSACGLSDTCTSSLQQKAQTASQWQASRQSQFSTHLAANSSRSA